MDLVTHCIVYRLHKNNSPVVVDCYSEEEQNKALKEAKEDGYSNAYKATPEQALKVLNDFGEQFKPKELTREERWYSWALGKR